MSSLSLGFSTVCLGNATVEEIIELARQLDFDHIEIPYEAPFLMYGGKSIFKTAEIVKDLLVTYGLSSTLHAPHKDLNFSSYHPEVQKLSITLVKRSIYVASILKSSLVTFHCGKAPFNQEPTSIDFQLTKFAINECLTYSDDLEVKLAIENAECETKNLCKNINGMQELLSNFPHLLMTLDTSHCLEHKLSLSQIIDYIHHFHPRIHNVHLSLESHSPLTSNSQLALNLLEILFSRFKKEIFITLELHDRKIKNSVSEVLFTDKQLIFRVLDDLSQF